MLEQIRGAKQVTVGRKQRDSGARRILADFLIGAHAHTRGYRLLTLDERLYKAAFPTLRLETV